MHVTQVRLVDFRSYQNLNVNFEPGNVLLLGQNGQGKTNLVEAIAFLSNFRSHRASQNSTLIRKGATQAIVQGRAQDADRAAVVEVAINSDKPNSARLNGTTYKNVRELAGIVRAVIFAPEDSTLAKGEPAIRRRYLDDLLVQLKPATGKLLTEYEHTLRQRAALLKLIKQRGFTPALATQLEVWTDNLIKTATPVIMLRKELVGVILETARETYRAISDAPEDFTLSYEQRTLSGSPDTSAAEISRYLTDQLGAMQQQEVARGVNLVGPHLDDLGLSLAGLDVRQFASSGESWSVALALRIAAYDLLRGAIELPTDSPLWLPAQPESTAPILILDDVFSQLDPQRRRQLLRRVDSAEQVFVTAAARSDVPEELSGQVFDVVENGIMPRSDRGY